METKEKINIEAGTAQFKRLFGFDGNYSIKIPDYQRPFVWNADKVETLINDLEYHIKHNSGQAYYMGSILFFCQNECYEIIDGQQRLTSLLILDRMANNDASILELIPDRLHFYFNSPISKKNIVDVKNYIKEYKIDWLKHNWNNIVSELVFSVIVTYRQDDAFSFFETQNNRGVKLGAADYLKSFHLRELREDEGKQVVFAKQWDTNNKNQFLNYLFNRVIWRGRSWKGSSVWYESQDEVLQEFQKRAKDPEIKNQVKIYPTVKNKIAHSIRFDENDGITLDSSPITLTSTALNYPFCLRQPIEKGIGFFLYSEKYAELYYFLFHTEHKKINELSKCIDFFNAVYIQTGMSEYLTSLYRLCLVLFYDKFESKQIDKFARYLDYYIGVYRIELSSIYDKTVIRILRDKKQNLLDIISQAFTPEQVFDFIIENTNDTIYRDEAIPLENDNGQILYTVRSNYKRALLKYYGKEAQNCLKAFKEWIK